MTEEAQRLKKAELQLRDHEHIPLVGVPPDGTKVQGELDDESGAGYDGNTAPLAAAAEQTSASSVAVCQASTEITQMPEDLQQPVYYLDGASVVAAVALGVEPGDSVLDLCSAPGGKSLVLASILFTAAANGALLAPSQHATPWLEASFTPLHNPALKLSKGWQNPRNTQSRFPQENLTLPIDPEAEAEAAKPPAVVSKLVCNESSRSRCQRLRRALAGFIPSDMLANGPANAQIHTTNCDAVAGGGALMAVQRLGPFDKILVDAPCTSDRHLVQQGTATLSKWAAGAVKANAERQLALLRAAAPMVKPGGSILYCTCALSAMENDGVVAKFLKKGGNGFEAVPHEEVNVCLPGAEATELGTLIMPDKCGYGPIYLSRMRKL